MARITNSEIAAWTCWACGLTWLVFDQWLIGLALGVGLWAWKELHER